MRIKASASRQQQPGRCLSSPDTDTLRPAPQPSPRSRTVQRPIRAFNFCKPSPRQHTCLPCPSTSSSTTPPATSSHSQLGRSCLDGSKDLPALRLEGFLRQARRRCSSNVEERSEEGLVIVRVDEAADIISQFLRYALHSQPIDQRVSFEDLMK